MSRSAAESVLLRLTVNGRLHEIWVGAADTLLDVLRGQLGLTSCRETCGLGLCGSCTVTVDGRAVSSCIAPAFTLDGAQVRTAEGLGTATHLDDLQQAFVDQQAFQCSFCTPGFLMSATAMLEEGGEPDLHQALGGHLCRCGSYRQIVEAIGSVLPPRGQHVADRPQPEEE